MLHNINMLTYPGLFMPGGLYGPDQPGIDLVIHICKIRDRFKRCLRQRRKMLPQMPYSKYDMCDRSILQPEDLLKVLPFIIKSGIQLQHGKPLAAAFRSLR